MFNERYMHRAVCSLAVVWLNTGITQAEPGEVAYAARADAFRQVCDQLLATQGRDGTSLRDGLIGDAAGEIALRRAAWETCTFSEHRIDTRGRVRTTARLELGRLRAVLLKNAASTYVATLVDALGKGSFVSVGVVSATAVETSGSDETPPGWENTKAEGLRLAEQAARRAATDELVRRLAELVGRDVADMIGPRVSGGAEFDKPEYTPYQVCVVSARVRVRDALRAGYVELDGTSSLGDKVIEVRGFGMAPIAETYRPRTQPARVKQPAWSVRRLLATGRGADADIANAKRAARVDAIVKLAREIDGLQLPDPIGQDMRRFIEKHSERDDVWSAYLDSVRTISVECKDGECSVSVEADLAWLWRLIVENLD